MNKIIKWLKLATNIDREDSSMIFNNEDEYWMSLDGWRIHIAHLDLDNINKNHAPKLVQKSIEFIEEKITSDNLIARFAVNPEFLMDAISVWQLQDEPIIIELYDHNDNCQFIRIRSLDELDNKQAIVMNMRLLEKEENNESN